ncbi:MAG: 30S ribosomal protein S20 [Hyphomicrobiaceae bacterium]
MANTKSAARAARVTKRRTEVNKSRRTVVKSTIRAVEDAIAAGKKGEAEAALKVVEPQLMRGVQKGIVHKKTASRKVSRLSARVKGMSA